MAGSISFGASRLLLVHKRTELGANRTPVASHPNCELIQICHQFRQMVPSRSEMCLRVWNSGRYIPDSEIAGNICGGRR